jgi:hypothetical protein
MTGTMSKGGLHHSCQLKEIVGAESLILSSQSRFDRWLERPNLVATFVKLTPVGLHPPLRNWYVQILHQNIDTSKSVDLGYPQGAPLHN